MFYALLAILLNFVTFIPSYFGMEIVFAFMDDAQMLLMAIAMYKWCPMRRWRQKVVSYLLLICISATTVHNSLVYLDIINEGTPVFVSVIIILSFMIFFSIKLMSTWDNLPTDKIDPGYIYEVIGKPRNDLQFFAFLLSGGRGGTWAHTDGVTCWYFNTTSKVKVSEDLNLDYLIGRKVIKIGVADDKAIADLNSGVGKSWSLINNCWFSI